MTPRLPIKINSIEENVIDYWILDAGIIKIDQKIIALNKIKEKIIYLLSSDERVDVNRFKNMI